jgi:probable HAF family extracellular repeat protein
MKQIEIPCAKHSTWALWSSIAFVGMTCAATAQFYAVTDLGTLGGPNGMAYAINNHEQIVGTAQTAIGNYHAFMFDGGRMIDLGTMGGSNSWAYGMNDSGWMVGAAEMPMTNMHAFLCTNALMNPAMMDLGTLGGTNSAAWMINMHGGMVGWATMTNSSHHAFFMSNSVFGDMMDMGTAGGTNSEAYCINSNGMMVGYAMMSNGSSQPIMATNPMLGNSSMITTGMGAMGASGGCSWFVNDMGDTAGQMQMPGGNHHASISGNGGMMGGLNVDLGTLGGSNSTAYCLNDAGTAVGVSQMPDGMPHAFMATNALGGVAHMMDLNALIPTNSGWELMEARSINSSGQIVGWGMHAGHTNAFLLTPVSAPVVMTSTPIGQIVGPGVFITMPMGISATEPLTYQWLHNGSPIPGATSTSLSLPGMTMENAGLYVVTARNAIGMVASAGAVAGMFTMDVNTGTPHLIVAAPGGSHFRIDYSNLVGPSTAWQTLTNFTMLGVLNQISDMSAQAMGSRFYRAVMTP